MFHLALLLTIELCFIKHCFSYGIGGKQQENSKQDNELQFFMICLFFDGLKR